MDYSHNSRSAIEQTHKVWKKNSIFLYNVLQTYQLPGCSQTVDWFSDPFIENDWKIYNILIGCNSLTEHSLRVVSVGLPTDDSLTNYTCYSDEKPQNNLGSNRFVGTMGKQHLNIKLNIPQASEILRARINHFQQNLIAVKMGGSNPQLIIYDLRNKEEQLQNQSIRLQGHNQEGYGLVWSPHLSDKVISGSKDGKILFYDIQKSYDSYLNWENSGEVNDVKWHSFNPNIIGSAHSDQKVNLWDIRSGQNKPFISKKAHMGKIYAIDFNKKSENLLISGGEDGQINLWDVRNMSRKIHCFIGHNDSVKTVSWNPHNTTQFATGSIDRKVVIWDSEKLQLNTKENPGNQITFIHGGHKSSITDLNWSFEKQVISTCEEENVMQIWQINEQLRNI